MLVEFIRKDKTKITLNDRYIVSVKEEKHGTTIHDTVLMSHEVEEDYEEVKKILNQRVSSKADLMIK